MPDCVVRNKSYIIKNYGMSILAGSEQVPCPSPGANTSLMFTECRTIPTIDRTTTNSL